MSDGELEYLRQTIDKLRDRFEDARSEGIDRTGELRGQMQQVSQRLERLERQIDSLLLLRLREGHSGQHPDGHHPKALG